MNVERRPVLDRSLLSDEQSKRMAPWCDLPESFRKWNSVSKRLRRSALEGAFDGHFEALSRELDFEHTPIDGRYLWRHFAENLICRLKEFRGTATRYDKTDQSFATLTAFAAVIMTLK